MNNGPQFFRNGMWICPNVGFIIWTVNSGFELTEWQRQVYDLLMSGF